VLLSLNETFKLGVELLLDPESFVTLLKVEGNLPLDLESFFIA
jgi:hypothetical protein